MFNKKRRKFFADRQVQGALAKRLVTYWCMTWLIVLGLACSVAAFFGLALEDVSMGQLVTKMLSYLWFPLVISMMVLPLLIRDCVRVSNRFAGPVLRFRRAMRQLADGETVQPISFRDGDFWQEIADDFNRVLSQLQPQTSTDEANG